MSSTETKQDNFQMWLFHMDDALEEFLQTLPEEIAVKLDYGKGSLNVIENWILDTFKNKEQLLLSENKLILDGLSRYIGETFRKNIGGGKWSINLEDKMDAFYSLPVLKDHEKITIPVAPHTLATACISRKKGTYISGILENILNN